jgi:hypothetical protein
MTTFVKVRIEELTSLEDVTPKLLGWGMFPGPPQGVGLIGDRVMHFLAGRWEVEPGPHGAPPEAVFAVQLVTPELMQKLQVRSQIATAPAGVRMGASGPILDLNAMRRNGQMS